MRRDYDLIRDGKVDHLLLRSVEGETISRTAQHLIKDLQRDFPDKFTHQIISRHDAREIWARGLEREPTPQLELPGVGEQARQQKAKQREARQQEREREQQARAREQEQRKRDKELVRSLDTRELDQKKELLRVQVVEQSREIAEAREKGRTLDIEKQRESHTKSVKGLDEVREIERAKTRDMLTASGVGREQVMEMEKILEENRENQRKDVVRELAAIGSVIKSEEKIRADREAIEKQREQIREAHERAIRAGVPRDVLHVWEVSRLQPGETPRPPPEHQVHEDRHHREAAKERKRAAERERNSRYRGE